MTAIDSQFPSLEGTRCYCSAESAEEIRHSLKSLPRHSLHRIGIGDYHYISLFWLERIQEPFDLVLLDNHPDDQCPAFDAGMISCGGWVAMAERLPMFRRLHHIKTGGEALPDGSAGAYISIDTDVLSRDFARTDWDQGKMSLEEMERIILAIASRGRIIGADLCGGILESQGATAEDLRINAECAKRIESLFKDI